MQRYNKFLYLQIFFNFFYTFFHCLQSYIYKQVFFVLLVFLPCPLVVCSVGVLVVCWSWSCVQMAICHIYAHIYAHTHARARGFLDSNF